MSDVSTPDVEVKVVVAGHPIFHIAYRRVDLSPNDWEATAAIYEPDARQAVRACLLAALASLQSGSWEVVTFAPESGGETDDQLPLPF